MPWRPRPAARAWRPCGRPWPCSLAVVAARALAAGGGETVALRAAATVKSELRRKLTRHTLRLGPAWLGGQQVGEIATLATKGLDALDPYFARYLPQLVLAVVVPVAVVARVAAADWISAVVIAVTLPLIPVFAVLVGLHTKARTQRQWRLLATLGGHFLDVVEGPAHAETVRPGEGAGAGDRCGLRGAPEGDHGHAAGGVPVGAGAGAGGGAGHGAGGGGGGPAAAGRAPGLPDRAAGAAAHP